MPHAPEAGHVLRTAQGWVFGQVFGRYPDVPDMFAQRSRTVSVISYRSRNERCVATSCRVASRVFEFRTFARSVRSSRSVRCMVRCRVFGRRKLLTIDNSPFEASQRQPQRLVC